MSRRLKRFGIPDQIAEAEGAGLQKALDIKMSINRLRTWAKQSDGTYQHKEEK